MSYQHLLTERADAVLLITLNRPAVLNALNAAMLDELDRAFSAAHDDDGVRVVVVTGAGDKSFVAGADVRELAVLEPIAAREYARRGQALFDRIERLGKPVIAAVNGFAVGGGCELAMACTLRIAAETAKFGQPEINLGLIPGYAGSQRLPRLVGRGRALELLLTGAPITAQEAWRIGLVNRVVPADALRSEALAWAAALSAKPVFATRLVLDAVAGGIEMTLPDAQAHEAALFALVTTTEDMREGTAAFLEKRQPRFTRP